MGRAGTDCLVVMLAPRHHLRVVDRRNLRIPLARALGIQKGILLDQIRAGLGDMLPFCLAAAALGTGRHQAAPPAEVPYRCKARDVPHETGIHRGALRPHAFEAFERPTRMDLAVERAHDLGAQVVLQLLQMLQLILVAAPACTTVRGSYQWRRNQRAAGVKGEAKICGSKPGQAKRSSASRRFFRATICPSRRSSCLQARWQARVVALERWRRCSFSGLTSGRRTRTRASMRSLLA